MLSFSRGDEPFGKVVLTYVRKQLSLLVMVANSSEPLMFVVFALIR